MSGVPGQMRTRKVKRGPELLYTWPYQPPKKRLMRKKLRFNVKIPLFCFWSLPDFVVENQAETISFPLMKNKKKVFTLNLRDIWRQPIVSGPFYI